MNVGDRVHLNGDAGTILELRPADRYALVQWDPGDSDISGRVLWCPMAHLYVEDAEQPTLASAHRLAMELE